MKRKTILRRSLAANSSFGCVSEQNENLMRFRSDSIVRSVSWYRFGASLTLCVWYEQRKNNDDMKFIQIFVFYFSPLVSHPSRDEITTTRKLAYTLHRTHSCDTHKVFSSFDPCGMNGVYVYRFSNRKRQCRWRWWWRVDGKFYVSHKILIKMHNYFGRIGEIKPTEIIACDRPCFLSERLVTTLKRVLNVSSDFSLFWLLRWLKKK